MTRATRIIVSDPIYCGLVVIMMLTMSDVYAATAFEMCLKTPARSVCATFYVRYDGAPLYSQPDTSSAILWNFPWGDDVSIDWKKNNKNNPKGWVYYYVKVSGDGKPAFPGGWIETKNLAGLEDFKRVTGCWPIKHFVDDSPLLGDYEFEVTANTNGRGEFTSLGATGGESTAGNIWFTDNLVIFGARSSIVQHYDALYGYDPITRKLLQPVQHYYLDDELTKKAQYFSSNELKGCEQGLKLQ